VRKDEQKTPRRKIPMLSKLITFCFANFVFFAIASSAHALTEQNLRDCHDGNVASCVQAACGYYSCSYKSDIIDFTRACHGADGDCVKTVCTRMSCVYKSELMDAINACGGH
jgi:hypothetical protein